jgi:surfactin synthase thioesterase subunit/glycosyltransferase involved in cell wall biosynthesis
VNILLAHNSTYYPSMGGGDKSNRLLMEALAGRGHRVLVVTRVEQFGEPAHQALAEALAERGVEATDHGDWLGYELGGVEVRVLTRSAHLRGFLQEQIESFEPGIIITSTDDPGQLLFEVAVRWPKARVVHLVRATIAVPFGPDSSMVSAAKTDMLRRADGVVGVSHYVAAYVRQWSGIDAVHVPISLLEPGTDYPLLGDFENEFVSMVNPCAVKGISIFLGLADAMPDVRFAAVPLWGTQEQELAELQKRPNITLLPRSDRIDDLLERSRVVLVPSVWAEARSRMVLEAMSRGVPVIASDVGGLHEAKLGVPYLVRVNPIVRYHASVDAGMVPVAEVPPQEVAPWVAALRRLITDRAHWEEIAGQSRRAALEYCEHLNVQPFEAFLESLLRLPKKEAPAPARTPLSEEKRRLLAMRIRHHSGAAPSGQNAWFPGVESDPGERPRLFCFPWAGGGTLAYRAWKKPLADTAAVCPVRLPGRESRASEKTVERMEDLIPELLEAIEPFLDRPFHFFGHSMGAGIAFELARSLRGAGLPGPVSLHVSGARAPQYRRDWRPGPEPSLRDFIEELRRLEGFPPSVLANPELMRLALPALLSDARLYRNYVYSEEEPLGVPIFAYGGDADPNVTSEHMEAWKEQTTSTFQRVEFPGGHFFLESAQPALLAALRAHLQSARPAMPR